MVESTYNWYWLVDGLMEKGHRIHLANTVSWSDVGRLENSKFGDVVKIVVTCRQTVNPKLIHRSDDQRIIGKEPVSGSNSLSSVQPRFVGRQNEDVQTKDRRCLCPVFCEFSDFPPFAS